MNRKLNSSAKTLRTHKILLSTINARYSHPSLGLRLLLANLGEMIPQTRLIEFNLKSQPEEIIGNMVRENPDILGLSITIWNRTLFERCLPEIRNLLPKTKIILGGPEVSFDPPDSRLLKLCDYLICGEADLEFAKLCKSILDGSPPSEKIIRPDKPSLKEIRSSDPFYTDEDLLHKLIYVESSRGCPHSCEFCLSSLDHEVRYFDLEPFLSSLDQLFDRGGRRFKFVDRTFNLKEERCRRILDHLLPHAEKGASFHFEFEPSHLPPLLRESLRRYPPATLQLEIGIQTLNPVVSSLIRRKPCSLEALENIRFLRQETQARLHLDLIAGLPGEDEPSLADSFNRLVELGAHEIQLGILKNLPGTAIHRHADEWGLVFSDHPPYEILQTKLMDRKTLLKISRFSRYWEEMHNSGRFPGSLPLLWKNPGSAYEEFMQFSEWLFNRAGQTSGIALDELFKGLFEYLTLEKNLAASHVRSLIERDYHLKEGRKRISLCED